MIAITGASGQLGRLVVNSLLEKVPADEIVLVVRSPEKVEDFAQKGVDVRTGDYAQPESLTKAFKGIDKLLLISSSEVGARSAQHKAVIDTAVENAVGLLVYTSILKADASPMGLAAEHKVTEEMIEKSAIPSVILRNSWYSENFTAGIGAVLEHGIVFGCSGDGRVSAATRADYAEAAATVLVSPEGHIGNKYELAGDVSFSMAEFAATVAKLAGQDITYQDMSEGDYAGLLQQVGLPEGFANALADSGACTASGWLLDETHTLSKLIGRATTSIEESIKQAL